MDTAVVVFTSKDLEVMFGQGGSGDWAADRDRLSTCQYLVAVANAKSSWSKHPGSRHSHAFLVGKVSGAVAVPGNPNRTIIQLSEYAEVDVPGAWKGQRNPVRYSNLSEFGISTGRLAWKEFPASPPRATAQATDGIQPLSVEEAKAGLAAKFGVPVESIEITIRA
jgi:hypothetical protein